MRILVDYRPALRDRTGVGEYLHQVACSIGSTPRAGETLTLFSSSWKDRLAPDVVPGARTIDRPVPVRALNFTWHRLELPAIETLTGETFDVVQSSNPLLIPSRTAAQAIFIADLDFLDRPDPARPEVRRDYAPLARAHAARADAVLTISRHTASEIVRRLDVPADRIVVAYPGAPPWPRRPAEEPAGEILFLGTLEPRKNLDRLLDAYERLIALMPDAPKLVLAGGIPPEAAALVARTASPPFAGRVSLPGYVDETRRRQLYNRAIVFVMPSHTEGFGMPVVEAMTIGVPVVAANRGALPEVVGDAGRLVDPDDTDGLARALMALVADASERRRLSDAGTRQAARFTWASAADQARAAWSLAIEARRRRG